MAILGFVVKGKEKARSSKRLLLLSTKFGVAGVVALFAEIGVCPIASEGLHSDPFPFVEMKSECRHRVKGGGPGERRLRTSLNGGGRFEAQ